MRPEIPPSIFNVPASCLPSPKPAPRPTDVEDQQLRYFLQRDKITSFEALKPEPHTSAYVDTEKEKKFVFLTRRLELLSQKQFALNDYCFALQSYPKCDYEQLRDFLVLPCKRKLQYITSSIDKDQVLRETFDKVQTLQQKNVFLLVDEVQIHSNVLFSGGLLSGVAENNRDCKATSILITRNVNSNVNVNANVNGNVNGNGNRNVNARANARASERADVRGQYEGSCERAEMKNRACEELELAKRSLSELKNVRQKEVHDMEQRVRTVREEAQQQLLQAQETAREQGGVVGATWMGEEGFTVFVVHSVEASTREGCYAEVRRLEHRIQKIRDDHAAVLELQRAEAQLQLQQVLCQLTCSILALKYSTFNLNGIRSTENGIG
ncbi:hypothetical protein FHG87_020913 [Trinorchestia longiramus]|nr:hypothetical protein FHG87_020913 [Trinorchestia longiramus]